MSENDKDPIALKVSTIKVIYASLKPYAYKINSLIKWHYDGSYTIDDSSLMKIMEMNVSMMVLDSFFQDLIDQAEEVNADTLYLKPEEFATVYTLSKTISSSFLSKISTNISILEH